MSANYTLKILADFAAAHTLRNYPGDCSRMHGHNWKLEVEVTATALNEHEMGMDFKTIKTATRELAKTLDHRYFNDIAKVSGVTLWETDRACVRYSED